MLETSLVLGMIATHAGVPLADLLTWALVLALLVAPVVPHENGRRRRLVEAAARNTAGKARVIRLVAAPRRVPAEPVAPKAIAPAITRLSTADQWQTVTRLVSAGAERAIAVARDHQKIRRELDSLDFSIENLRRELASVMTLPAIPRGAELIPVRAIAHPHALAA